jgi:hypothetical protein
MVARRQCGQSGSGRYRKQLGYRCAGLPDRQTIGACVRHRKQDVVEPRVAALEHDPAGLRLEVVDPGLGFGRQRRSGLHEAGDHRVPCALIAVHWQRHFGAHGEIWVQAGSDPVQQS